MPGSLARMCAGAIAAVVLVAASSAQAGGLYLLDRGTRALGRGFAFVAGADDPGALWYNPAGIAWAGRQLLLDTTLTLLDASFARVDGGGNAQPSVDAEPAPMPIPTLAYTDNFGLEQYTFGFGVLAPNMVALAWPSSVEGGPAPQRYSLLSLEGSVFVHIVAAAAWQPSPELSLGLGVHLVVGTLRARTTLSACDRAICTQPENPAYDSEAEVALTVLTPTATLGVVYDAGAVRLGASVALPHSIGGSGTLRARVPSAAIYDRATIDGQDVEAAMTIPWIFRAGAELRAVEGLRLELATVVEMWSQQTSFDVKPQNVHLRDVVGVGDYLLGAIEIPRQMNDVFSVRLGGEYAIGEHFVLRGGAMVETSSFSDAYLTPLTLDSTKLVAGLGISVRLSDGLWIDASYGHAFMEDRTVTESLVPQPNPIRPPPVPPDGVVFVGNGKYGMEANAFGIGMRWQLEAPAGIAASAEGS